VVGLDGILMGSRPALSDPVTEALDDIIDEHDVNTYDQAVRYALREMEYDV